jgi:hypothetical protein
LELQIPVTLNDVLKKWSHQAGCFDVAVPKETREKAYLDSLMAVFSMFARHHTELEDGDFVRAFRFFKDAGFTKRLSLETHIAERYGKLERTEPGFEKKPEPKPEPVSPITEKLWPEYPLGKMPDEHEFERPSDTLTDSTTPDTKQ